MSQPSVEYPLTQEEFNRENMFERVQSQAFLKVVKSRSDCSLRSILLSLFPIFSWLHQYDWKAYIIPDILCGFTVAIMHVPQGMAYAVLGNVDPITGLYVAVFPTLIYVFMGTSRHISLGSFSITSMMAAAPVTQFSTLGETNSTNSTMDLEKRNWNYSPAEVASALCVSVGMFQVLLGCVKAGHLSVFLSKPIISGLTNGAAVLVLISQLNNVFGIKLNQYFGPFNAVHTIFELAKKMSETNLVALAMSVAAIFFLSVYSDWIEPWLKWKFKLPIELIIMICGALISFVFDFEMRHNIRVVGDIPTGFPGPKIPKLLLMTDSNFLFDSAAIGIIGFAVTFSMATIFAMEDHYKIDANQELFAYGFGNIFGGFFPCLPMAASLSRSMIQYQSGGKTQLVIVFSSIFLILTMAFVPKYLYPLPYCVLAGIVIKSLKSMLLQVKHLPKFWRDSSVDGVIWILTFVSVIILDIISGLGIALVLAILSIILMNQNTYVCMLGQVPQSDLYLEMQRYRTAKPVPGIMLVQIYAGVNFANINICINRIDYFLNERIKTEEIYVVILVFSAVLFVDPEALEILAYYINELHRRGIKMGLAECTGRVYEQMNKCHFFEKMSEYVLLFPSTHNAVSYYQKTIKDIHDDERVNKFK